MTSSVLEEDEIMGGNAYSAYQSVGTSTADPVSLTTMLYDGAITAIKKSRLAIEDGRREVYTKESMRAYEILGELLATLDMSQGELPKQLSGVYTYCMRLLVESAVEGAPKLNEAEQHITNIANAWKAATAQLRSETASTGATDAA
jgi:flagellar protein FliS